MRHTPLRRCDFQNTFQRPSGMKRDRSNPLDVLIDKVSHHALDDFFGFRFYGFVWPAVCRLQ